MKIVTGHRGEPHILSNDQQGFNYGVTGTKNCVFNVGNQFNVTYANETLTIHDGEGVMQGVHFRIPSGQTDQVTISPTSAGYTRIDLLCARYTKAAGTGIESVNWHVITGTPSTGTPSTPSGVDGNILAGASTADFPMYAVLVDSSGVSDLTKLFSNQARRLIDTIYPVGSIYVRRSNVNPSTIFGEDTTWALRDKRLITLTESGAFHWHNVNVVSSGASAYFWIKGNKITFRLRFTNAVELNDSAVELGTLELQYIGLSACYYSTYVGTDDNANALIMIDVDTTSTGIVTFRVIDVLGGPVEASTSTTPTITVCGEIDFDYSSILNGLCDRFYWERIS